MRSPKIPIGLVALVAGAGLICFIVKLLSSYLGDRENPAAFDDADLTPARVEVAAESNAFGTLLKATNSLYWPDKLERQLNDLSSNTNWDDALAAEILDKNRAGLDLFDQALRQPNLLVPEPQGIDDDLSYLNGWKTICKLKVIQSIAQFRATNEVGAFAAAFAIVRFGHRVENCGGAALHYSTGASIKSIGLARLRQLTGASALPAAELERMMRELDAFRPNQAGLTNAVKMEYQTECRFLDDFAHGKFPDSTNSEAVRGLLSLGTRPVLDVSRSKLAFARANRFLLGNLSRTFGEIEWSRLPVAQTNAWSLAQVIRGNALGETLYQMLEPPVRSLLKAKCREDVNVTATQLLLALKIYKMRNGQLPESLGELTPEFFPQVPLDNFDGKPFRYLPGKKLIYSVGPDLKDAGGEDYHQNPKDYDLPFNLEF